jgi:hypothetical protein
MGQQVSRHTPRVRSLREQAELERIGRERLAASREVERTQRWELVRCCGEMIASAVVGMGLVGLALRANDRATGEVFLWTGVLVIVGGVFCSMALAYRRAEKRGDL